MLHDIFTNLQYVSKKPEACIFKIRPILTIEFRFVFDAAKDDETLSMAGWGIGRDQMCITTEGGPSPYHPCKVYTK